MTTYAMSKHFHERRQERRIRDAWIAAALCRPPTYHIAAGVEEYYDPKTRTVVILDPISRVVRTVYRAGKE